MRGNPRRTFNKQKKTQHKTVSQKVMGGGGFEPPKQFAADLQSVPFGHSGIHPFHMQFAYLTVFDYNGFVCKNQAVFP